MTANPKEAWRVVSALGSALQSSDDGLKTVPQLLRRVLDEGSWREFETPRGVQRNERFVDFITSAPTKGLGASVGMVKRMAAGDTELLDMIDQAVQNPVGHNEPFNNVKGHAPVGNAESAALRRLRKESEGNPDVADLRQQVLAGTLTAHAAMIQAGFRPRTFTIRAEPESAARTIKRQLEPHQITELIQELQK